MLSWFKSVWVWLTRKNDKKQLEEPKEVLPEKPILKAPPPIRKGSLEDIRDFCDEIRKDLSIRKRLDELRKKTDDRLYVEMGNIKDKIKRFLESQK